MFSRDGADRDLDWRAVFGRFEYLPKRFGPHTLEKLVFTGALEGWPPALKISPKTPPNPGESRPVTTMANCLTQPLASDPIRRHLSGA